jgi:tetratricopeptide (TPR) repeat protein
MTENNESGNARQRSPYFVRALSFLKDVDLKSAHESLGKALEEDYESAEVAFGLKCSSFWLDRESYSSTLQNPYQRGSYLLTQWKAFLVFTQTERDLYPDTAFAFRQAIFTLALKAFNAIGAEALDADLYLQIGRCHKGRGDYEEAISYLEKAFKYKRESSEIIAELADVYALMGEMRMSKALFREAFFLDPQRVDLDSMQSFFILGLAEKVKSEGFAGPELLEWISVYGVLLGLFTVKRELKPIELGKLNQSIYQLENSIRMSDRERPILVPRLINRYFWQIDHLVATNEDKKKIKDVLLKIKLLDQHVYRLYTA